MSTSSQSNNSAGALREKMNEDVDSLVLVWLRIGIGIAIFVWAYFYTRLVDYSGEMLPLYDPVFLKPRFLFKYAGFEWVQMWPGNGIAWHFFVTKVAAVALALGFLTRLSGAILCGSIAYVLLVERQIYLNHYYLLACLAGLMVFLPAGQRWSIDARIGIERPAVWMKRWQLWLLRFQVGIPYVYGAIAKMNSDWMAGQPAGIFLDERRDLWLVSRYLELPAAPLMFAWGGLLYDLLVVPMLLYRPTRWLAVLMSFGFHLTNAQIFSIGVFPWFMLAATIVFFPTDTPAKVSAKVSVLIRVWLSKYSDHPLSIRQATQDAKEAIQSRPSLMDDLRRSKSNWLMKFGFTLAAVYVVVQLVLPFRHWLLPGDPSWNERGHRFAWRMMLRRKAVLTTFKVVAPDGSYQFFPSTVVLTPYQSARAERNPELVRQAAVELKKLAKEAGVEDAEVYVLCLASLNGRRPVPLVNANIDLTKVQRGWLVDDWVNQELGPLPKSVWSQDKQQWWRQLSLPDQFKALESRVPTELEQLMDQQRRAAAVASR